MEEKIALLTDSGCDLPADVIEKLGIFVLPLKIIYGDQVYDDRVTIQPEEVYSQMPARIPTTSMPSVGDAKRIFEEIADKGFKKVLAIHISGGLSGTIEMVRMAAREFKDLQIEVFDTKVLSIAQGFQVYEAAKDIAAGLNFTKVLENVIERRPKIHMYYVIETLEYLRKGGRIGRVAAMLGELLNLKPIIACDDEGKYYTHCKARGRQQSIEKLYNLVEKAVEKTSVNLAVMHGGALEETLKLKERLMKLPNIKEVVFGQISPALGVHTGPGLIGVSFYEV
ncbi:MAG: DegV family protein [Solirubrobacterales bacterium]